MNRRIRSRLGRGGLAFVLAASTLVPLTAAPAFAETLDATLVNQINTSSPAWTPLPVDLSGVAHIGPHLLVTDQNVVPITSNAWEYTPGSGIGATGRNLFGGGIDEPTGVDYDPVNDRLFVSSDSTNDNSIYIINNFTGTPGQIKVNVESLSGDTEDPAFDSATDTLYFLDGGSQTVRKMAINPLTGAGVPDATFFIDLSLLSNAADWEAMTWNAERGTLVVAPHDESNLLYEIPPIAGQVMQPNNIIDATGLTTNLDTMSGLGMAPTTGQPSTMSYWIADRVSNSLIEITTNALGQLDPIAYNRTINVPFNTAVAVKLVATDANNDTLTYVIDSQPANGTLSGSGANRTYTPNNGFVGQNTFTFHANDGVDSNIATVTLNVLAQNTAPVLAAIPTPKTVNELDNLTFRATATDPEGNAMTFKILNAPAGATMTSTGLFSWRPSEAQGPGAYDITVRVTDSGGLFDQQVVRINVNEVSGGGGGGGTGAPGSPFIDDNGHQFENAITWLAGKGITEGCNPPTNNRFCPDDSVTRGQMAAFLGRAFTLPAYNGPDLFDDDNGHTFENAIEKLAQAGITVGCNPPSNNRFCPGDNVTRGQMAAFLVRAFELPAYNGPDLFDDDNDSVFEGAIERLAQAGITLGCNPPANDRFCPGNEVTRGQMAAFLKRGFGE